MPSEELVQIATISINRGEEVVDRTYYLADVRAVLG
jgi:hypothetical protein